jgi:hypothetical protein
MFQGISTYKFAMGDFYKGHFKDGEMTGSALIKYANGEIYEGEVKNGLKHGKGIFRYRNLSSVQGIWRQDQLVHDNCNNIWRYPSGAELNKETDYDRLIG